MRSEHFKYCSFRKSGKVHRGLIDRQDGALIPSCSCPGSQNGKLRKGATILRVDDESEIGWELSNCRQPEESKERVTAALVNSSGCKLDDVTGNKSQVLHRISSWLTTIEAGDIIKFS